MKILILGGSGILSTDFTKKTLDMGNNVWIVNRGQRKKNIDNRAKLIVADLRKETVEELRRKLNVNYYDVVIDFLSFIPEHIRKILNVLGDNYKQYIFISSATTYIKENENEIITEKNRVGNEKWEYAYNKFLCEELLLNMKINYTIIRPYVTYGNTRIPFPIIPDGYHYTLIERMREGKPVVLLDNGAAICTLTHTKDFAEVLYRLLLNEKAYKEDFHITSSFTQTWKDVYLLMCKILNVKPNYVSVSLDYIKTYLPEFYQVLRGDKGTNMIFDNSKVLNAIGGYEFKISLSDGLENSINYYDDHKEMQGVDFRWDGRVDYLISKVYKSTKFKILNIRNNCSNNIILYYIMRYQPFRGFYESVRNIKKKILK